ncbi:Chemotaxis regulator - transmits chemoreceptor signals to flagelllar motor component CheY [Salipiger mucosus DSM 16094]|uniref:Chemotaxis regulator-transmits chemoreceptor signals to flagelllar motor component CheY n=1 Tax=Salipiger mucosus DSM 16094 TaxID=1123237 RepID=S9RKL4_9RHOB|nr:Chemotaxis regulator - transmits chemoreceptor signals to flagelllar motor component CheY [Salipiger mucosus DSM 16094]
MLVVDDSDSVRRMITSTLRMAGYDTVEASDGQAALSQVRASMPAAVITDQNMPNLDGLGFIRAFRKMPGSAGVPVIFLSTENADTLKQKAREAGALGWMTKPFDDRKLLGVVQKVLGR